MNARSYALRLLKNRLRSAWEIDQALLRRNVELAERTSVIQELRALDLINDERYARAWIHTRDLLSPRGAAILRLELIKKGIAKDIISESLAERKMAADNENVPQPTEEEFARTVIERKARAYAHLDPATRNRRLIALLMRRGFSYDVARRILNT